jgi:hypothetical protein
MTGVLSALDVLLPAAPVPIPPAPDCSPAPCFPQPPTAAHSNTAAKVMLALLVEFMVVLFVKKIHDDPDRRKRT